MMSSTKSGPCSLGTIANSYGSSSEDDDPLESGSAKLSDVGGQQVTKKLKVSHRNDERDDPHSCTLVRCDQADDRKTVSNRLPPPSDIAGLFSESCNDVTGSDDSAIDHQGRLRAFPHERGNWATYVYVQYCSDLSFADLVDDVLSPLDYLQPTDHLHISLSRTVVFRHHWIQPFVESLKHRLRQFTRFCLAFDRLEVYVNEEDSRSFLSLKVGRGSDHLHRLVASVDACLQEFNLPSFYEDPSFHMSVGWCLGNRVQSMKSALPKLQEKLDNYCSDELSGNHVTFAVDQVTIKTGNRIFVVPLAQ